MPHLRIREIVDDLNELGGMTPAHHALITELVATCLLAAGPKLHAVTDAVTNVTPKSDAERAKAYRERKKVSKGVTESVTTVTEDAVDNNIIPKPKTESTAPPSRASRGTRLPDDWHPSENLWAWGKEKLPEDALRFETAAFKDYWAAKPGSGGCKLDWDKTWKTWIREAVRRRERFKPKAQTNVAKGPWKPFKPETETPKLSNEEWRNRRA